MRFVIAVLVLLGGVPALAAEEPAAARAKAFYEIGMKHYQVGDYRAALDAFKSGYFAKRSPAFLFNMGQCYRQLGDLDDEVRQYRAYLRESPNAANKKDVEGFIADAEKEEAARAAVRPADPQPEKPVASAPVAVKPKRRWWIGAVIGGAVVVAGGAVAIGLVAARPGDAPTHGGVDTASISF